MGRYQPSGCNVNVEQILGALCIYLNRNSSTAGKSKKRLQGGGRKLTYKDLDQQLAIWVREMRSKNAP
uniref:Uncharacterized protein n=1 Tax=Ditylenchus dipsaci TaxID=166011 RepID=A0A915CR81_9BILA